MSQPQELRYKTLALDPIVAMIIAMRRSVPSRRSVLVALSGIDGSGKGYVAAKLERALETQGVRCATIHVDGWLNLPSERFGTENPGGHFYRHAIRFDQLFNTLVLPLKQRRSHRIETDQLEETATKYERRVQTFADLDVILLEGIFLLKREFRAHYDLAFWIECSFRTALQRAIARSQEGLGPEQTKAAYRTIYFPAQAVHLAQDDPRAAASAIIDNDR